MSGLLTLPVYSTKFSQLRPAVCGLRGDLELGAHGCSFMFGLSLLSWTGHDQMDPPAFPGSAWAEAPAASSFKQALLPGIKALCVGSLFKCWLQHGAVFSSLELVPLFAFLLFWGSLCFPLTRQKHVFLLGS